MRPGYSLVGRLLFIPMKAAPCHIKQTSLSQFKLMGKVFSDPIASRDVVPVDYSVKQTLQDLRKASIKSSKVSESVSSFSVS